EPAQKEEPRDGGRLGLSLSEFSVPRKDAVHLAFAGSNFPNCQFRLVFVTIRANTGFKSGHFWSHDNSMTGPRSRNKTKKESPVSSVRGSSEYHSWVHS